MTTTTAKPALETERLRDQYYNSTVTKIILPHADLMILRLRPDEGVPTFLPGQFTVLGMGAWEPGTADLPGAEHSRNLIKRLYSISCSLIDDEGRLIRTQDTPYLEFYIKLVHPADTHAVALTPRLFNLHEGARLYCSREVRGRYTLRGLPSDGNVVFVATGTGEAPHNTMVGELLATGFPGQIVCVTCARHKRDLAYLVAHRELERRFPNYRYLTLTTREPENVDATNPHFIGKRYLQDYFQSGDFERNGQLRLSPTDTHVFLCGSPDMIGHRRDVPVPSSPPAHSIGMVDILEERGFCLDRPHVPGNIHIEKYW